MVSTYYKTFRVPLWVAVQDCSLTPKVIKWFQKAGALIQPWPSNNFKETLESFKKRGWVDAFKTTPHLIVPALLARASLEHVQKNISPTSTLTFDYPMHRINRTIKTDDDYVRLFDDVLEIQSSIVLAQAFQVAERCHREGKENYFAFVTAAPCRISILQKIADRVITIGTDERCDVNLTNVKAKTLSSFLEEKFTDIVNGLKTKK